MSHEYGKGYRFGELRYGEATGNPGKSRPAQILRESLTYEVEAGKVEGDHNGMGCVTSTQKHDGENRLICTKLLDDQGKGGFDHIGFLGYQFLSLDDR